MNRNKKTEVLVGFTYQAIAIGLMGLIGYAAVGALSQTSARKVESEIIANRESYLFNAIGFAIVETDTDWRVTEWSAGAERLFGYSRSEMLGETPRCLLPPGIASYHDRMDFTKIPIDRILRVIDSEAVNNNGRRFKIRLYIQAIRAENGEKRLVAVMASRAALDTRRLELNNNPGFSPLGTVKESLNKSNPPS